MRIVGFAWRNLYVGLAFLVTVACHAQVEPAGCLSYKPVVVVLRGILIRKTFPGPPNYRSIRNGDTGETYWFVQLDRLICVNQDRPEPDLNPAQKSVRRVQLVLEPSAYKKYKTLLGKRVVLTGTLFGAHSGHHHTPVLLTVSTLELPHWK